MNKELFDMDSFMVRYEGLSLYELQTKRNQIITKIWEYQNSRQVSTDPAVFADFQDSKIEVALLSKMIFRKYAEEFFPCPDCGLLCSVEEKSCRRCQRKL